MFVSLGFCYFFIFILLYPQNAVNDLIYQEIAGQSFVTNEPFEKQEDSKAQLNHLLLLVQYQLIWQEMSL